MFVIMKEKILILIFSIFFSFFNIYMMEKVSFTIVDYYILLFNVVILGTFLCINHKNSHKIKTMEWGAIF